MADSTTFPGDFRSTVLDELGGGTKFGHALIKPGLFQFSKGFVNVNNGAFGSCPEFMVQCKRYWDDLCNANPDRFMRYELQSALQRSIDALCVDINCASKDIAIVDNASSAVNAVFRSLHLKKGEKILLLSCAYGMVKQTVQFLTDTVGVEVVQDCSHVVVQFPFNESTLLDDVEAKLKNSQGIKLASFSHITSQPAVILPVAELQILCKRYGVLCFIDGAHAYGQTTVNMAHIKPDFYTSNGHKWGYVPRTAAFLYVRSELQKLIHPTVISFPYGRGFQNEFRYVGTRDYSTWLTFPWAIEFRKRLGVRKIRDYMHKLAMDAAHLVADIWQTEVLNDGGNCAAMADVRLPTDNEILMERCIDKLQLSVKTYIACHKYADKLYCRISAQIYNELSDYEFVAKEVIRILQLLECVENNFLWSPHVGVGK